MFTSVCVIPSVNMGGGHCDKGMCVAGACMAGGMCGRWDMHDRAFLGGGVQVFLEGQVSGGHVWHCGGGGVHGRGDV